MSKTLTWDNFGEYFGYPKCCRDSFETLEHVDGDDRKLDGTGYIPCLACNEKSEEELIAVITANRRATTKFPKEESWKKTLKNIKEMCMETVE